MVRAVHDFRGNYWVSDYRWFDLRDGDTSNPNFQQQYGLMRDDYTPKPAFDVVCKVFGGGECDASKPRLQLRVPRCRRAVLSGADLGAVRSEQ